MKTLREKTIAVYDLELRDNDDDEDIMNASSSTDISTFNQGLTKIKAFLKKNKSLPQDSGELA